MRKRSWVMSTVLLCIPVSMLGCDGGSGDDTEASTSDDSSAEEGGVTPTCELVSTVELADADTVAPNGRTGAEILAAIPASFQTTLDWDLSNGSVEVEVLDATGQSSTLDLSFSVPATPTFYFDDWEATDPSGEIVHDVNVICDDYVRTSIDLTAQTQDGALTLELSGVEVGFGPDHPETEDWATPFVYETRPLASPSVEFVAPVAQPADSEKTFALSFGDPEIRGSIIVYATGSDETHRIVVARW